GMHNAGDRAIEGSGDVDHIERVVSRAIVGDSRERANQNQSCQHLIFSIIELMSASSLFSGPCGRVRPWRTKRAEELGQFDLFPNAQAATSSAPSPQADIPSR